MALDFVIDENLDPWLVEFNTKPYTIPDTPVFKKIFPEIVFDWLNSSIALHGYDS